MTVNRQHEVLLRVSGVALYRLARGVLLVESAGDIDAAVMHAVLDAFEQQGIEGLRAVVIDISRLGSITKEARRVRLERTTVLMAEHVRVYVANATVVTRATLTMLFTARKLLTRRALHVQFFKDLEGAIERALEDAARS